MGAPGALAARRACAALRSPRRVLPGDAARRAWRWPCPEAQTRSAAAALALAVCTWSGPMAARRKGGGREMALNGCFSLSFPGNPQLGDLIEVFRPGYQHWALYLGDGYVINIAPLEDGISASFTSAKSVFSRKALVKMQLLKDVVGKDTYRINNKYDNTYPPLPMEEVMQRSEFAIGQEVAYDILGNNCEHFVTLLRYGEGVSEQANRAIGTIGFVTAAAGVLSLLGLLPKRQRVKYF